MMDMIIYYYGFVLFLWAHPNTCHMIHFCYDLAITCHNHSGMDVEHANRCKMIRLRDLFYELWSNLNVPLSSLNQLKHYSMVTIWPFTMWRSTINHFTLVIYDSVAIRPFRSILKQNPERPDIFYQLKKKGIQIMPTSPNSTYTHMHGQGFWAI